MQKYHDGIYTGLLFSGKLNFHLEEIDRAAIEMYDLLIEQYAERQGVTEELKAPDQMEWVRRMNSIRDRVETYIRNELICSCRIATECRAGIQSRPAFSLSYYHNNALQTIRCTLLNGWIVRISNLEFATIRNSFSSRRS